MIRAGRRAQRRLQTESSARRRRPPNWIADRAFGSLYYTNVLGLQSVAAHDRLQEVGLKPVVVSVHSLQEVGSVVAQHPAAGVDVVRGSSVSISVSGGPGP